MINVRDQTFFGDEGSSIAYACSLVSWPKK